MNATSSELERFLEIVGKVSASISDGPGSVSDAWGSVEGAGLPTLARDAGEEPDVLQWLTHTVRAAAQSSPALAYVLAARYAADLAIPDGAALAPTFALASRDSSSVIPTAVEPDLVVVLDVDDSSAAAFSWGEIKGLVEAEPRTGLAAAHLASFDAPPATKTLPAGASRALRSWDLLLGAALVGIAERAVLLTQTYVLERRQFGVQIGSFAGMRALVAEMQLRVEPVRALLDHTIDDPALIDSVTVLAGRAAVANCIDAIQAHGGYGYIVEYPVADLLRDSVSLQARTGGRRLHTARIARRGLGIPGSQPS